MRIISRFFILFLMVWISTAVVTEAQAQFLPTTGGASNNEEQSKEQEPQYPKDSLNRRTPRGMVSGYLKAMGDEDYKKAAQYFNLENVNPAQAEKQGAGLAQSLEALLNKNGNLLPESLLSDDYNGEVDDNLGSGVDRVGSYNYDGESIPVLVEKTEGENGPLWLFSQQTISQIPSDLNDQLTLLVDQIFPQSLVDKKWNGVPAGHWIMMIALIGVAYVLGALIARGLAFVTRRLWYRFKSQRPEGLIHAFVFPVQILIAVQIFIFSAQELGISIIIRQNFGEFAFIIALIAILLLMWRLIDVFSAFGERRMLRRGNLGALSAFLFFRRGVKFFLIAIGIIIILDSLGFDVTTGLAALGIGGIALALGAQKTVENLVGSITVIFDQPVRVGDFIKVGDTLGTIEQIGMRSTRIRTLSRTLVVIPNGDFSAQKIENYAHRDRFWYNPTLGLRYETSPDQLRYVLVKVRELLYAHPKVDPDPARIRFTGFGSSSLNLEIFAYVMAQDYNEFLEIQEDINLRIADIVNESGSGFAFPSQTFYMARDGGLSQEKTKAAEEQVQKWRESDELQLPKFDEDMIKSLKNTVEYPPKGAAVNDKDKDESDKF